MQFLDGAAYAEQHQFDSARAPALHVVGQSRGGGEAKLFAPAATWASFPRPTTLP